MACCRLCSVQSRCPLLARRRFRRCVAGLSTARCRRLWWKVRSSPKSRAKRGIPIIGMAQLNIRPSIIMSEMMLPSQKTELQIYGRIKGLGPGGVSMMLAILHQATGADYAAIVERLKSLEADGHITLSKYSRGSRRPRNYFDDSTFFY